MNAFQEAEIPRPLIPDNELTRTEIDRAIAESIMGWCREYDYDAEQYTSPFWKDTHEGRPYLAIGEDRFSPTTNHEHYQCVLGRLRELDIEGDSVDVLTVWRGNGTQYLPGHTAHESEIELLNEPLQILCLAAIRAYYSHRRRIKPRQEPPMPNHQPVEVIMFSSWKYGMRMAAREDPIYRIGTVVKRQPQADIARAKDSSAD